MKKFADLSCPVCGYQVIDTFIELPNNTVFCAGGYSPEQPGHPSTRMARLFLPGNAPNVVGDDIPGGVEIKHGICNADGTPKKYYSHSEIRRAAAEKGLVNRPERGVADKKDWDRLSRKVRAERS